ncbi:hypothetical protein BGW42_002076 [Actinomortierella wolfii]|nr:hypothetical protein BGW42_002076 [Actinomortierella wolfii]
MATQLSHSPASVLGNPHVALATELLQATMASSAVSTAASTPTATTNRQLRGSNSDRHFQTNGARRPLPSTCVATPTISTSSLATLEYSAHTCPRRLLRDLTRVFPGVDLTGLLVVPTFQKCQYEMVAWDAEIAKEKDDRLEDSYGERGPDVYPDVEGCQILLKYDFQNAGCCKILLHPEWGSKIYPATFFTTAPLATLLAAVREVEQENPRTP